jgi:signal transduction histidine kinase
MLPVGLGILGDDLASRHKNLEQTMSEAQIFSAASSPPNNVDYRSIEQRLLMQYNIARILAEANSINKAAAQVLKLICEFAGWEFGALWMIEPETQRLVNEGVWHAEYANLAKFADLIQYSTLEQNETNLPTFVLHSTQPLWLAKLSDLWSKDARVAEQAGLTSAFILPVRNGGKLIAILECMTSRTQSHDQNLIEMLNAVGNQIGIFLERKVLEEALSVRASQQQLLAQAGIALQSSNDYKTRLNNMMHVIVPDMADWCAVDIIEHQTVIRRLVAAHVDPQKEPLIFSIQPTREVNLKNLERPQLEPLINGHSLLYSDLDFKQVEATVSDPAILAIIRELNPRSSIVVPLLANDHILGICTLVQSDSKRHYLPSDLALAEDLGRRMALALDNALMYAEAQKVNAELERRVDDRTAQLKVAITQLTNQIAERQHAEEQVNFLNAQLEQRIAERTSQLEIANQDLKKEVEAHQLASQSLRTLLKRTRELYRISQRIGTVRKPSEVLSVLLSSSYLRDASRASIAILDEPWPEIGQPPEHCFILTEWNRGISRPHFIDRRFTLAEYGIVLPVAYGKPIVIPDIQSVEELPPSVRKRFHDLRTRSLIILPLIANGEWYGLLSFHFSSRHIPNLDDLRHMRGLVDQTAIAIKNVRLLEAESKARQEAEAANALKLKFLAMISHELRTPLASIKGFATTLLADDVVWSPERQRDFLETINLESDKLSDLIEQLLDLSRIEAGILRISPKKQPLQRIAIPALEQIKAVITDHELVVNIPKDLPAIYGDGQRIAQVITNLVGNANKYSPPRTTITVSARRMQELVQVDVADQGFGIPPQERRRIFEAFHQLENKSGSQMRGAGLGLAICKGLIEAQGGTIWVQDSSGPGTVVSFTIPVARASDPDDVDLR